MNYLVYYEVLINGTWYSRSLPTNGVSSEAAAIAAVKRANIGKQVKITGVEPH